MKPINPQIAYGEMPVRIRNLPFDDYCKLDAVNASLLKQFAKSPAHAKASLDGLIEYDSPSIVKGSALHASILTPDEFDAQYAIGPDVNRNTKEWKAFAAENEGKSLLKPSEMDDVYGMAASIGNDTLARRLLSTATEREMTLIWTDKDTGIACKARADLYGNGLLVDLKTTSDARPEKFARWAFDFGYPLQFAWYARGLLACGLTCESIAILAVENTAPWNVVVYEPTADWFIRGEEQLRDLLPQFVACKTTNNWPGYVSDNQIQSLNLPKWA